MKLTQGEDMGNIPPMTQKSVATSQEENVSSQDESNGSETITFHVDVPTQVDLPTPEQQPPRSDEEDKKEEERVLNLQPPPPGEETISSPEYDHSKLDPESSESDEEECSEEESGEESEESEESEELMKSNKQGAWNGWEEQEEDEVKEGEERGNDLESDEEADPNEYSAKKVAGILAGDESSEEDQVDEEEVVVLDTKTTKKNHRGRDEEGMVEPYRQEDVINIDSQDTMGEVEIVSDPATSIKGGLKEEEDDAKIIGEEEEGPRMRKIVVTDKKTGDMEVVYFDTQCKYTNFFNSRKDQNKDQKFRIGILENFVGTNPTMDMVLLFARDIRDDPELVKLRDFLKRTRTRKAKFWTKEVISVHLATLVSMLRKSDAALATHKRSAAKEPTAIAKFRAFLVENNNSIDAEMFNLGRFESI